MVIDYTVIGYIPKVTKQTRVDGLTSRPRRRLDCEGGCTPSRGESVCPTSLPFTPLTISLSGSLADLVLDASVLHPLRMTHPEEESSESKGCSLGSAGARKAAVGSSRLGPLPEIPVTVNPQRELCLGPFSRFFTSRLPSSKGRSLKQTWIVQSSLWKAES